MPLAKLCNSPGCRVINNDGASRCAKHKTVKRNRRIMSSPEARERAKFYNTQKWRKLSKYIRTKHPLCEVCENLDEAVGGQQVDHVREIQDHPELKYDFRNLQHLCIECHRIKTRAVERARNNGTLKLFYNRYEAERTNRKRLEDFSDEVTI